MAKIEKGAERSIDVKGKMLQEIERAQIVINQNKEKVSQGKMRQKYHFMAETGWINDPNGLIYFKGKYHFSISIIHIRVFGKICTGDMLSVMI